MRIFFTAILAAGLFITVSASEPVKVGVYKSHAWQYKNWGICNIVEMLKVQPELSVVEIENLRKETLDKLDVLIISTTTKLAAADSNDADRGTSGTDWRKTLLNFVQRGGGLYMGYYAAGFDGDFSTWKLFPMIAGKTGGKNASSSFHKSEKNHDCIEKMPASFAHMYDHLTFEPGPQAVEVALNQNNQPVILAGEIGGGRVIYCGIPFGLTWNKKDVLNSSDTALLSGMVHWLAAGNRKTVSLEETAKTLFAEVKQYNDAAGMKDAEQYNHLPSPEFKDAVLWLPIYGIKPGVNMAQKDTVLKVIENAHQMGFSKVMIMAKFGSFMYRTRLPTKEHSYATSDFDPVECAVIEARKRGMKVGLTVCPFCCRNDFKVYNPDLTSAEAEKIKSGAVGLDQIDADKPWCRFNCPDDPAVRKRGLDIAAEIIEKFKPDEINLDYIRYKDNYNTSCFCDYSQGQKAEFLKQHPEVPAAKLDESYAKYSLTGYVKEFVALCRKLKPDIVVSAYTISAPTFKAPEWVNNYNVDFHAKYVSRQVTGPESKLSDISPLVKSYYVWASAVNPGTQFSPIIASFDRKTPERIEAEFKIVYDLEKQSNFKVKRIEYFEYGYLLEKGDKHELDLPVAKAVSRMLGGTLHQK